MSPYRRTPLLTVLCLLTALIPAAPAAAEIVSVGEPFPIESVPSGAVGGFAVRWLPPGGTASQPPGFLVAWSAVEEPGGEEAVLRTFVAQNPAAAPEALPAVGTPDRLAGFRLTTGLDRRSALVFATSDPPVCYGGFLFGPALDLQAALQPTDALGPCFLPFPDAALLADGRLVVVYERPQSEFDIVLEGQLFSPDGEPVGEPFPASFDRDLRRLRGLEAVPGGFLVASYHADAARDQFSPGDLILQRFAADGQPLGAPVELGKAESLVEGVRILPVAGGFVAVWTEIGFRPVDGATQPVFHRWAFGRRLDAAGEPVGPVQPLLPDVEPHVPWRVTVAAGPGDTVLVAWAVVDGAEAAMHAQLLTADLAPAGERAPLGTRAADGAGPALAVGPAGDALAVWFEDGSLLAQRLAVEGECTPSETVLCLQGGRFEVSVEWADFQGNSGPGHRVPVASDDSGLFWFFHPENWEMLVKVLDACPLDGHFWVFAAAATNVEYTLTISDLVAHQTRIFRNDLGDTARALTVTDAFPTCGAAEGEAGSGG